MIDWQGLLKFSLKFSDGTKASTFTEMSPDNKKWLQEAMQHYTNSEVTRIKSILEDLSNFTQLQDERTAFLLEELQELLDSLDKGSTLYKLGGHIILLKIIFYSKLTNCRVLALQIYSSANQNDAYVQNQSINTGALEMVDLLRKESDMKMKQNLLTAVSATIRGQNLEAKRIFVRIKGLELLQQLYKDASPRLTHKINVLWRDLLLYDDNLHRTYNDLSHFSNTSNIAAKEKMNEQNKHNLSYDINEQYAKKNELPENVTFKGCIKRYLESDKGMLENYLIWLKKQILEESSS